MYTLPCLYWVFVKKTKVKPISSFNHCIFVYHKGLLNVKFEMCGKLSNRTAFLFQWKMLFHTYLNSCVSECATLHVKTFLPVLCILKGGSTYSRMKF